MKGYLVRIVYIRILQIILHCFEQNNPSATKNSITEDKWFKTGDVAIIDNDGFYKIVDRQKELIKYKGFQGELLVLSSMMSGC